MKELSKNKNKKRKTDKMISWTIYLLMCLAVGFAGGYLLGEMLPEDASAGAMAAGLVLLAAGCICMAILHVFLHETGHMVCGMISGYEFCSIRFFSFIIVKQEGKLVVRRFRLPGFLGQCLMKPPAVDGSSPFRLYHWGGCIMNLAVSVISLMAAALTENTVFHMIFLIFGIVGVGLALMNGIPLKFLSNDGYNAITLSKRKEARIAVEKSLLINEQISENVRIKDMPEEWFDIDERQMDLSDNLVVSMAGIKMNYQMDRHCFREAYEIGRYLLDNVELIELQELMLRADMLYCELIGERRREVVEKLLNEETKRGMRNVSSMMSVQRMWYTYYQLYNRDEKKAEAALKLFEKIVQKYPYQAEVEAERELMREAEKY